MEGIEYEIEDYIDEEVGSYYRRLSCNNINESGSLNCENLTGWNLNCNSEVIENIDLTNIK